MKGDGMAKSIARWVALGALFLIPLTPLLVADSYFFPFITGKAFYFRILIEIAVGAWVVLAFLDKEYRPRFSWVGAAVVGFVAWMFVADLFAPNVAKAFWSNFERMEGWVLLIHLLGFFFASSAVLRVEKKWREWFIWSLIVSVVVSGYAILQLAGTFAIHQGSARIDASLGNSAYLAIYFFFNVCIALWLALTPQKDSGQVGSASRRRAWLKWPLIALAVVETILIFFTETRGTIIGLVLALALAALLTVLTAGKKVRHIAAGALVFIVILIGGFYLARNSSFVQNNHVLQRIATISLNDGQTRFTIWHMAFQGALERPLTGWGQEGFNYVFNKYYDPSLYAQEPWFDRAHNAFIDWLTAGGLPAFLLYLSLFGSALFLLWKSSELSRPERIALTAALVGYAVHNIFVFDNLYSYVYFFAILALIDSQVAKPILLFERAPVADTEDGTRLVLPITAVAVLLLIWSVNVSGQQVAAKLIGALSSANTSIGASITAFEELSAHPSFAAQEVREQLVSFAANVVHSQQATNEEKQKIASLAIGEMQKQVAAYPADAREHMQLSYAYRSLGDTQNALKEVQTALILSPNKEAFWIEAGALEWDLNNAKEAQTDFNTAYTLGSQFPELAVYAAAGDMVAGDEATANKILLAAYGTTDVDSDVLAVAYYRMKNWPRLISIWRARVERSDANASTWFGLASAYYMAGDKAGATAAINTAVAKFPDVSASGAAAIKQIQTGL